MRRQRGDTGVETSPVLSTLRSRRDGFVDPLAQRGDAALHTPLRLPLEFVAAARDVTRRGAHVAVAKLAVHDRCGRVVDLRDQFAQLADGGRFA
jgi:hypothetical protein